MEEVKEKLKAYRNARRLYEQAKMESEEVETLLTSAGIDYTKVRVQTSAKDFTEVLAKLADLHTQCVERMDECTRTMADVLSLISEAEDAKNREILSRRYIKLQRWEEIAAEMRLDYRWVFRKHDQAVAELEGKHAADI